MKNCWKTFVSKITRRREPSPPKRSLYSYKVPPLTTSTVSDFDDTIPASSSNLSSSACYSNFYLKLPNGKYMVRVRTADRVIIGSYIIEEHM
ncbi:hypothetical protein BJV82DRAFT_630242, partial [Fennellomyces sp. T-0311]